MMTWQLRAVFQVVLCGVWFAAAGCRKKPEAQAPYTPPPLSPVATPSAEPNATPVVNAGLPTPDPANPLTWPVIVPVGKDGRALVSWTAARRREGSVYLRVGNGPQRVQGSGSYAYTDRGGQRWFSPTAPPAPAGSGASSQQRVGSGGNREVYDADAGETEIHHANGDFSLQEPDGSFTTLNSGGTHADGETASTYDAASDRFHHWFSDGRERVDNPNGGSITYPPGSAPDGKGGTAPPAITPKAGGDKPGGGAGDPHYTTRDGVNYSPQQAGEFVLVAGGTEHAVQARHQPWFRNSESVSVITALAVRAGGSRVEIRADGTALLDGQPAADGAFVQGNLPGGGAVGVWRQGGLAVRAVVVWPDLSALWVTIHQAGDGSRERGYLDFVTQWHALAPEHRGLLGTNDDNPTNDLTNRSGRVLDAKKSDDVQAFVESWRVLDAESLFTYAPGESTATYTLKDFPKAPPNPAHRAQAEAAVAGLPPGAAHDNCLYDIAVTGDATFAASYQAFGALFHGLSAAADRPRSPTAAATPAEHDQPTPSHYGSGMTITPQEIAGAEPIKARQRIKATLGANESRVYKFAPDGKENALAIRPYLSGGAGDYVAGKTAGYAWFDDRGKMLGEVKEAHQPWVAWWKPDSWRPTGTYYLKVVGPGDAEFELPF